MARLRGLTPAVIAVPPDATALDASEAMIRHMVRRVFVVDGDGVPVGVVSTTDLFRALKPLWGDSASARAAP